MSCVLSLWLRSISLCKYSAVFTVYLHVFTALAPQLHVFPNLGRGFTERNRRALTDCECEWTAPRRSFASRVYSSCASAMPDLLGPDDQPLKDSQGNVLKKDQMVEDEMFGDGITRGTIPLENGRGRNVLIDWLVRPSICAGRNHMAGNSGRSQVRLMHRPLASSRSSTIALSGQTAARDQLS